MLAYVIGGAIGLVAGYSRTLVDPLLMRIMDVLLAFPPLLFLLVLATGLGTAPLILIVGVAAIHVPGIARIVRAATLETSVRGYVEAAVARGEPMRGHPRCARSCRTSRAPIVADGGPRLTVSILLVGGPQLPRARPAAARGGLGAHDQREPRRRSRIQPWAVVVPGAADRDAHDRRQRPGRRDRAQPRRQRSTTS